MTDRQRTSKALMGKEQGMGGMTDKQKKEKPRIGFRDR